MNKPIAYWIKRLDAALEAHLDSTLAKMKLSRKQWQTINILAERPLRPAALNEALLPLWGSDTKHRESELASLVGRGMIVMVDEVIALSERGRAARSEAEWRLRDSREEITAGIGIDEYAIAVSVLERMALNAERLAG
ncbi:MarR family transcriptional regulator [bacterium RCC_150]